jgi:hypothetical protein
MMGKLDARHAAEAVRLWLESGLESTIEPARARDEEGLVPRLVGGTRAGARAESGDVETGVDARKRRARGG